MRSLTAALWSETAVGTCVSLARGEQGEHAVSRVGVVLFQDLKKYDKIKIK